MNQPDDADLRARFATQRADDAGSAPGFNATLAAARSRRRPAWVSWRPALAVLALLLVTAIAVLRHNSERRPLVSLSATKWQSPTDFLLRVPGGEYLETVPRLTYRISPMANWRNP